MRRLPRLALLLLCAAYVLPGMVGRGPWKSADLVAFGYMAELAQSTEGIRRWFDPLLMGLQPESPALMPYWLGAWAIKLAPSWLSPDLAVRIVFGLLLWGTFTATWYAVYYLARTPRAQPVAFAFGGEARPTDYARAIADGALLALIATLGLAQLGHETTPALAQLFFVSHLFYGVAALPYHRISAFVALAVGSIGMTLSGGAAVGLILGSGCVLILLADRRRLRAEEGQDDEPGYSGTAIAAVLAVTVIALLVAALLGLLQWRIELPPGTRIADEARGQARLLLWFTWPALPLALWTLWRWRRQLTARHVALPLWFGLIPLLATWFTTFSDRSLLLALPPFATLAAFALPTLRRSVSALIDWFTLLFFSGMAITIWVIWVAMMTGVPPKPAANVARLAPGFEPHFSFLPFVFALVASLAWAWLVRWRTGRHRAALWKTLVLPAGGVALCWMLLMTLWLPLLDYARSYAPQVRAISKVVGQPSCISGLALGRSHIAALRHDGQFNLQPLLGGPSCPWLLVSPDAIAHLHELVNLDDWRLIGTLRRPTSPSDDLLLYQRISSAPPPA